MALNANALIDLALLKSQLPDVDVFDTSQDTYLELLINATSQAIESYLKKKIKAADYVDDVAGDDEQYLFLPNYPIISVSDVQILQVSGSTFFGVDEVEYTVSKDDGTLFRSTGWYMHGYSNYLQNKIDFPEKYIRVSYRAGYEDDDIPPELILVCLDICKNRYVVNKNDARLLKSYKLGDVALTWNSGGTLIEFTADQLAVLNRYRRRLR